MKLPPLTSFRVFNVAAQADSFVQAAEQLHVTHGAVSLLSDGGQQRWLGRDVLLLADPGQPCSDDADS